MRQFKLPILCVAVSAASMMLVSCNEEDQSPQINIDSNISPDYSDVKAITSAKQGVDDLSDAVSKTMADMQGNMDSAMSSFEAMSMFSSFFAEDDEMGETFGSSEMSSVFAIERKSNLKRSNTEIDDTISALFDLQNAQADLSTNTITVGLNSENFCESNDADCLQMLDDTTLSIQVINSDAGVVTVQYGGAEPLEFAYAPNYLAALVDLAELKTAALAYDVATGGNDAADIPSTFEGQFAVSISATTSQASVVAWIPEAIAIGDGTSDMQMSVTNNLATVTLDGPAQTVQFTSAINAMAGQFTTDDQNLIDIAFGGANFDLLFDGIAQSITLTNSGTVGNGLTVSMDNDLILSAMLAPLTAAYVESTQSLTFSSLLDFDFSMRDDDSEQVADTLNMTTTQTDEEYIYSIAADISANTVLFEDVNNNDALTVQSGTFDLVETTDVTESCEKTWADGADPANAVETCTPGTGPDVTTTNYTAGDVISQ